MYYYVLAGQVNFAFQIAILAVLFVSLILKRRGRFFLHGTLMLIGVVLNLISFLLVMGPSLVSLEPVVMSSVLGRVSVVIMLHAGFGTVAEILAILIVASWRLREGTRHCIGKKRFMLVTFVFWLVALLFGIILYILQYTDLLL